MAADEFRAETSTQKVLMTCEVAEDDKINPHLLKAAIAFQKTKNKSLFTGSCIP